MCSKSPWKGDLASFRPTLHLRSILLAKTTKWPSSRPTKFLQQKKRRKHEMASLWETIHGVRCPSPYWRPNALSSSFCSSRYASWTKCSWTRELSWVCSLLCVASSSSRTHLKNTKNIWLSLRRENECPHSRSSPPKWSTNQRKAGPTILLLRTLKRWSADVSKTVWKRLPTANSWSTTNSSKSKCWSESLRKRRRERRWTWWQWSAKTLCRRKRKREWWRSWMRCSKRCTSGQKASCQSTSKFRRKTWKSTQRTGISLPKSWTPKM